METEKEDAYRVRQRKGTQGIMAECRGISKKSEVKRDQKRQ